MVGIIPGGGGGGGGGRGATQGSPEAGGPGGRGKPKPEGGVWGKGREGGGGGGDKPYLEVGFWDMARKRGGWLAILFLGEMLTATAMGYFEGEIERAAVVALFVPLIISSGGNSGSQGTSLIIRSLALRELRLRDWWRVFGRELRTGLALGLFLGVIGFCRIGAWQGMSHVPHIGAFFQTHAAEDIGGIPPGVEMGMGGAKLSAPGSVAGFR